MLGSELRVEIILGFEDWNLLAVWAAFLDSISFVNKYITDMDLDFRSVKQALVALQIAKHVKDFQ